MAEDYITLGKRKTKSDKKAKARFNKFKVGGRARTARPRAPKHL